MIVSLDRVDLEDHVIGLCEYQEPCDLKFKG